jgi:hypothetical protein
LVILTLVPKDILGCEMVKPLFAGLYEASPVCDWAKQYAESRPKIKTTPKRFIALSLFLR